jgi:predicted nucleic-acid-binding protein
MKRPRRLPDTNTILRYLLGDNPEQYRASREFFESVRTGRHKAYILESVLVECVYVLMKFYDVPRKEVAGVLTGVLQYRGIINPDRNDLIDALSLFADKNLDIVDCIVCVKAKSMGMPVFSLDRKVQKCK